MGKYTIKHKKYIANSILRWLLFTIILVAFPPVLNCLYRTIIGRYVNYYEVLPDVLLIVVSICCNLIGACFDGDKQINLFLRWLCGFIFSVISIGCWGLYLIIYFSKEILHKFNFDKLKDIESINLFDDNMSKKLFDIFMIIIILCALIGSIIEFCTAKRNKSFIH